MLTFEGEGPAVIGVTRDINKPRFVTAMGIIKARKNGRDSLLNLVWGYDYLGDSRTVDVHIRRLREKLERDPAAPELILTKWGVGYYFAG